MLTPLDRRHFLSSASTCALIASGRFVSADQWTGWRGLARDGFTKTALPTKLSTLTERWKVSLSDSYSGPLVTEDKVIVTATIDKALEAVTALARSDGKELWSQKWEGAMSVPFFAKSNGDWIRATPATNGDVVVVGGMRDVVKCADLATGNIRWQVDFREKLGNELPAFGLVCSPLLDGDHLFIQAGGGVRKMALQDGALLWSVLEDQGGMNGGAFSSPIIAELAGKRQLVVQTRSTLAGVDCDTGNVLWRRDIASFRGMNILTPTVWRDHVYTSCYGGRSLLFKISQTSDQWSCDQVWESKAEAYMSSPVIANDHLYVHLRNQRLCCIRLTDGQEMWRTSPYGKYWSMVTDGSSILALDERGMLYSIAANPEKFELLDQREVSSQPCWAHLAVADGQIFIRHQQGLLVLGPG